MQNIVRQANIFSIVFVVPRAIKSTNPPHIAAFVNSCVSSATHQRDTSNYFQTARATRYHSEIIYVCLESFTTHRPYIRYACAFHVDRHYTTCSKTLSCFIFRSFLIKQSHSYETL